MKFCKLSLKSLFIYDLPKTYKRLPWDQDRPDGLAIRALVALVEDPGSVPIAKGLTVVSNSRSRGSDALIHKLKIWKHF